MKNDTISKRTKVCIIANEMILKYKVSGSEAFKAAWAAVKADNENLYVIEFFHKGQGKKVRRVVRKDWQTFSAAQGGAPRPAQMVLVDMAKVLSNQKNVIIGPRRDSILSMAA